MARIRTIKPEFFTSPDTAKASVEARLFYIALWCWADDWGIGEANLNALLGFTFPEDDQRERKEIQSLCKEVANTYGTLFYENNGRYFYQIPSWEDHQKTQRRAKRKNPTADDPESQPDKRIYDEPEVSERTQGNSETTQGNDQEGTGEQGNIGTGEQGNMSDSADAEPRPDVETILNRIDKHCDDHDFKKPNRTKANTSAARLLIDKDEYTVEQVIWIMDWVSRSGFWAPNIRSATKLREKFDQLKGQAQREQAPRTNHQRPTAQTRMMESAAMIQRLQEQHDQQQTTTLGELE